MAGKRITITVGEIAVEAELNDSASSRRIYDALPIEAEAHTWGHEIFFEIPVALRAAENAREDMEVGELGYWPPGQAFCIFFGPTPASDATGKPKAASDVNPIGRIVGDATVLTAASEGDSVVIDAGE